MRQEHRRVSCRESVGPVKRCGCPIHVKLHLLCSPECKDKSPFPEFRAKPLDNASKEDLVIITEGGPPLAINQIFPEHDLPELPPKKTTTKKEKDESETKPAARYILLLIIIFLFNLIGIFAHLSYILNIVLICFIISSGGAVCIVCFNPGTKFCGRCKKIRYCTLPSQ